MSALEVRDARKSFGATRALDGMTLALGEGQMLGLLGPNGAGKTTLIRTIAGRVRLDGGSVALFGTPRGVGGARPDLGVVPQENALYPLLTARENLETFGRMNGLDGRRLHERASWALEWTGLVDRARSQVKTFSGGMKRRLNLACGVLHEPRLVLLDEPTVGVDPQSRNAIFDNLEVLKKRGKTLVYTTHYMEEAERLADRIVVIDHGRVVANDTLSGMQRLVPAGVAGERVSLEAVFLSLTGRSLRD